MIQDEMLKEYGWVWDVNIGFHANESSEFHIKRKQLPVSY